MGWSGHISVCQSVPGWLLQREHTGEGSTKRVQEPDDRVDLRNGPCWGEAEGHRPN